MQTMNQINIIVRNNVDQAEWIISDLLEPVVNKKKMMSRQEIMEVTIEALMLLGCAKDIDNYCTNTRYITSRKALTFMSVEVIAEAKAPLVAKLYADGDSEFHSKNSTPVLSTDIKLFTNTPTLPDHTLVCVSQSRA